MKKYIFTSILALLFAGGSALTAQNHDEYLGLPGDNLNLYAVMNLFQESETLEAFEKGLNDPNTMINNLDLNGDNYVDYLMVFDYAEGDVHNIVIRVALNQNEYQDVAVFTVWKLRDGSVQVQLIGDEALYGRNYIVEPFYAETPNPGYRPAVRTKTTRVIYGSNYAVASWPVIVYISRPSYRVWRSSWTWGYYPSYWSPWNPHYYHYYYGYHYNMHTHYYAHYRPWKHYRSNHYHNVYYTNHRHHSTTVIVNVQNGKYKDTYSRPDKRKEGEVVFAQRQSRRSTVPGNTSGRSATAGRDTRQDVNEGGSRPENNRRGTAVNTDSRSNAPRQTTGTGRTENPSLNTGRTSRGTAVQNAPAQQSNEAGRSRNTSVTAPTQRNESGRSQNTSVNTGRSNRGTAVQSTPAPRSNESGNNRNTSVNTGSKNRGTAVQSTPAPRSKESGNSQNTSVNTGSTNRGSAQTTAKPARSAPERNARASQAPTSSSGRSANKPSSVKSSKESKSAAPSPRSSTSSKRTNTTEESGNRRASGR